MGAPRVRSARSPATTTGSSATEFSFDKSPAKRRTAAAAAVPGPNGDTSVMRQASRTKNADSRSARPNAGITASLCTACTANSVAAAPPAVPIARPIVRTSAVLAACSARFTTPIGPGLQTGCRVVQREAVDRQRAYSLDLAVGHRSDAKNRPEIERSHEIVSHYLGVIVVRERVAECGEIRDHCKQQQPGEAPAMETCALVFQGAVVDDPPVPGAGSIHVPVA